ncbi:HhH-GPD family protein [Luminiphilus syltensis NOR5-1B]|uniref:DNA-3-methyladenine glycosylase II n=1 Tax=Luminiphilus syltensis NOR5-1B TaxID=565045 RepID=B8KXG2_9GAMM|nr:DNA-3-methyladenine glycosylase [Luminiphilus syltensis]EED35243.1 HhH-GPD family protein [Luminiphilus syltensis NOR5-1B]
MTRYRLTTPYLRKSIDALSSQSMPIARAVSVVGYPAERRREAGFAALARIIIGQQVSVAAASSIAARVEAALGGEISADQVSRVGDEKLRSAGLSRQKVNYLRELARHCREEGFAPERLVREEDDAVLEAITAIKGFGVWSAQMYLMFSLGRTDIWPVGDLAVRAGFGRIMALDERPDEHETARLGEVFSPHRSALAMLCWKFYSEAPL